VKLYLAPVLAISLSACALAGDPEALLPPVSSSDAAAGFVPDAAPAVADAAAPPSLPDATSAASADAGPVLVPGVGMRYAPPAPSSCGHRDDTPILPEESSGATPADEFFKRGLDLEENGGLDPSRVLTDADTVALGAAVIDPPLVVLTLLDSDGDCLADVAEARAGTDPRNPDTDGDGWFDGPCNERRKLVLTHVKAYDEQEDIGDDELYLVADDVRHPQSDLDAVWDFDDGQEMSTAWTLATRARGTGDRPLALVRVEGWEDDFEIIGDWSVDDLLFDFTVDLGAYAHDATFSRRLSGDDDYDYELTFRVDIERFADPTPTADGDGDGDGIRESSEARVSRDLGGIADPARKEVFVEVDWMRGHALRTQGKRMVVTQLHRNGIHLVLHRDEELPVDGCLTVPEARALYASHFGFKGLGAFRYAVIGEELWNDRSGVAWGDVFLVDDSTWWINNWILPQAGTFIHELGHTLGLTQDVFHLIDTVAWFSYDSAMNYLYQATKVDYSSSGDGGDSSDHDDWAVVDPAHALRWSFALTTSKETGSCR